jgi:hypothetical protein
MNYLVIALTMVGAAQAVVLWVVSRRLNRLDQVEARLGHLTDALTLLAETAESGFRANAQEVARIADGMTPKTAIASRTTTKRVATAAKKGRAVSDIAAAEQVSEGEVNLRLHLAEAAARSKGRRTSEANHGSVRA